MPARRRTWRVVAVVVLLVLLGFPLLLAGLAWWQLDKVPFRTVETGAVSAGRVYLLVGSDSREDVPADDAERYGTVEGRRTDTILLLAVPRSGRPALVSVPRDSLVDIPGHDADRINAAYAIGGPPLLVETLETATGVRVDDYVEVGFGGFVGIVDAVGGIEVCLDEPIQDEFAALDLPAGCQTLGGTDALGYVRARHFDPRSDIGRVERQREFLGALVARAASPAVLVNPLRSVPLAWRGGAALTVGEGTGPVDLARFALGLRSVSSGGGDTLTVPLGRVGNTVTWDDDLAAQLWSALQEGREVPAEVLAAQPD